MLLNYKMQFSNIEKKDLLKGWVGISLAFAILLTKNSGFASFLSSLLMSMFTVGLGFLLHELGHKYLAQNYNCWAEFRSFDFMILLAILMSFFGFIFAAPGAVMIHGNLTKNKYGKISAMGPVINIILALVFLVLYYSGFFRGLALNGFYINSLLAAFNMLPI